MNGKVLEPAQIFGIHTSQGWNIIKGSKDQTGTWSLSYDEASSPMEKQSNQFSIRLNSTNHKTNATRGCIAYHTESIKRITYGNRLISSPDIMNLYCQQSHVFMVWPSLPSRYTAKKIILQGTVHFVVSRCRERRQRKSWRVTSRNGQASRCRHC